MRRPVDRTPRCSCYNCNCPYGAYGFHDLIVPDKVWKIIGPTGNEGGLLCPTCIIKALDQFGLQDVPVYFASGPARAVPYPETTEQRRDIENSFNLDNEKIEMTYSKEHLNAIATYITRLDQAIVDIEENGVSPEVVNQRLLTGLPCNTVPDDEDGSCARCLFNPCQHETGSALRMVMDLGIYSLLLDALKKRRDFLLSRIDEYGYQC